MEFAGKTKNVTRCICGEENTVTNVVCIACGRAINRPLSPVAGERMNLWDGTVLYCVMGSGKQGMAALPEFQEDTRHPIAVDTSGYQTPVIDNDYAAAHARRYRKAVEAKDAEQCVACRNFTMTTRLCPRCGEHVCAECASKHLKSHVEYKIPSGAIYGAP